ncbi:MAG: helix-turn-helix transcriptional regulator [Clostridiaceae bacterium]|nr:helix-turn-helix transcriptional regulator [Clostridiaceae bacterium]
MRDWLREKRNFLKLTQEEVAKQLDISRAHYTQIELGQRNPSPKLAKSISNLLDVPWTKFFEDIDGS